MRKRLASYDSPPFLGSYHENSNSKGSPLRLKHMDRCGRGNNGPKDPTRCSSCQSHSHSEYNARRKVHIRCVVSVSVFDSNLLHSEMLEQRRFRVYAEIKRTVAAVFWVRTTTNIGS